MALTQVVFPGEAVQPVEPYGIIVIKTPLVGLTRIEGLKSPESNDLVQGELQQLVVAQLVVNV